jgi:hypothetical protein
MYFSKLYVLYLLIVMDHLMVYRGVKIMYNVRNLCLHSVFCILATKVFGVFFVVVYLENAAFLIRAHPRWLSDFSFCPPEGLD